MKKTNQILVGLLMLFWLFAAVWLWFGPRQEVSEAERRKLEQFPQLSWQTVLDGRFMSKLETFSQDQFPVRDGFRRVKAVFGYEVLHRLDNNGIYLVDGYAAKLEYPLKETSVTSAMEKFEKIKDRYLRNCETIVFAVVPDKGYYLAGENGYPAMDYAKLFSMVSGIDWAEYVDLTDCLSADCYYRTDTHWRQETLLPAAEKIAAALDVSIADDYVPVRLERPFYGVYYGQAALPMEPDTMYVLESDTLDGCTVINHEDGSTASIYDRTKLESRDLYDVFLSGAVSVLEVENPAAETDRELIVFRDSFGSSLVPLLVPGYARVTLVDTRYIPTDYLGEYVEFGDQDVLFLYSPLVLNNSAMLK